MSTYRTIVADPPWAYDEGFPVSGAAMRAKHPGQRTPLQYPSMTVPQIAELPVDRMADADAHLYLWTTNRYLRDAFDVLAAWGFSYSQTLVWAKTPAGMGLGGAWVQTSEYVLFGRRGSLPTAMRYPTNVFSWPRTGRHSKKPEAFLDMVEAVSPAPRLEMFARRNRLGWDTYGNESLGHVEIGDAA